MVPQVLQLGLPEDGLGVIIQLLWFASIFIFMFYGQRIQMHVMLREVESHLRRLKFVKDEGR